MQISATNGVCDARSHDLPALGAAQLNGKIFLEIEMPIRQMPLLRNERLYFAFDFARGKIAAEIQTCTSPSHEHTRGFLFVWACICLRKQNAQLACECN